ncbi:SPOR domain-containing protein [Marinicella sediminis]|uniref:SPOR domain-containing protein n=1 Tax=Marinicella sediminis TaxID=1792834 RepID=A0ABV7J4D0_9GAMM|nr:SPOR domain-containing protein [Marinicella sediminis]
MIIRVTTWLSGLWLPFTLLAQEQPADPDIENNIVCYAAKSKWVCAPADDQAQAREKARKLAVGESLDDPDEIDPDVAIQTIDYNDTRPQNQQPAAGTQVYSVNDFVPRADALQALSDEETTAADSVTSEAAEVTDKQAESRLETSQSVVEQNPVRDVISQPLTSSGPSRFAEWQQRYPRQWSFQVIGTSNRHKLGEFISRHQLGSLPYSVVKTQVNGADWWVVLVGLFDSRDSALAQRHQLPAVLAPQAWVRQIASIDGESE